MGHPMKRHDGDQGHRRAPLEKLTIGQGFRLGGRHGELVEISPSCAIVRVHPRPLAPEVRFETLDGQTVHFRRRRGKLERRSRATVVEPDPR